VTPDIGARGAWAIAAVRGSVAAATVAWAAAECLRWRAPARFTAARVLWSAGALLITVHAIAVFHFIHGWSHNAALAHTARQTALLAGLDWSWGLYVNYAFIALWLADCAWTWWDPSGYRRRSTAARDVLLVIFLFMFVNGAVVFAPWPARALGTLAVIAVVWSRWTGPAGRGRYISAG
jgi:hypothetical protein